MTKEELAKRDIFLLIDKSSSMLTKDMPGGKSRWDAMKESTIGLVAKAVEIDADGISILVFAGQFKRYDGVKDTATIERIFQENEPNGSTNTGLALKSVLDEYVANKKKPIFVLVVTDGDAQDRNVLIASIIETTKKMDADEEVGIQFLQIGKDAQAGEFLKFLDDQLVAQGAKFDIVDTTTSDDAENITFSELLEKTLSD